MGKHSGPVDPADMTPRERNEIPIDTSPERIERDVNIVDNGWNNTPEDKR